MFDQVSDDVITEIASWLIAPRRSCHSPSLRQLRDLGRFSSTCNRFRNLCRSSELWQGVDIGEVLGTRLEREESAKKVAALPQISACHRLTEIPGVTALTFLSLVRAMPRLRDLEAPLTEEGFTATEMLEAIGALRDLVRLRLNSSASGRSIAVGLALAPTVKSLELNISIGGSSVLFPPGVGQFRSVEKLAISEVHTGISSAIRACPCVTELDVEAESWLSTLEADEAAAIWDTCAGLTSLSLSCPSGSIALDRLEISKCAKVLRKLHLDVGGTSEEDRCSVICRSCPNLADLKIVSPALWPSDVRAISMLSALESFSAVFDTRSPAEEMAVAFAQVGRSGGVPFKRLEFKSAVFDPSEFFSSRRCSRLEEISHNNKTQFPEHSLQILAENAGEHMKTVTFSAHGLDAFVLPLLEICPRLTHLRASIGSAQVLRAIGTRNRAPLETVEIVFKEKVPEKSLKDLAPALSHVKCLAISLTGRKEGVISLIKSCPMLERLELHKFPGGEVLPYLQAGIEVIQLDGGKPMM